ncbi:hypothetical protein PENTCL1PPCAC_10278, partial [Pristionchus entomophagus]
LSRMCGAPKSKLVTGEKDFTKDCGFPVDRINELVLAGFVDEAEKDRIIKLETELTEAKSKISRLQMLYVCKDEAQKQQKKKLTRIRGFLLNPFNIRLSLGVVLGALLIDASFCLFIYRSTQTNNSSSLDSSLPAFDSEKTPAREVKFMHLKDYSYDFAMLGGFVSDISGKSEKAGLKIGDEILSVNGVDVREKAAEVIYNLIWKTDAPSGKEESRFARHDWEKPLTLVVRRNLFGFERLQSASAKASKISLYCGICLGAVLVLFIAAIFRALPFCK